MNKWWSAAFAPALVFLSLGHPPGAAEKENDLLKKAAGAESRDASDANLIEGLWFGSWGGGEINGVGYQPVMAELYIAGNHVELCGFRNASRLTGTVRFDASAKRMEVTPAAAAGGPRAKAVVYTYAIENGKLTLVDSDKSSITLHRQPALRDPLANVRVDLVAATGINATGDLLVTEFTTLRAGRAGATYFWPMKWPLKTKQATVLLVQEAGCRQVTLDEARRQIREPTLVVVAYRHDERPKRHQLHGLWKEIGPPAPDSETVSRTFSRILRPGTLVFVLSARENVVEP